MSTAGSSFQWPFRNGSQSPSKSEKVTLPLNSTDSLGRSASAGSFRPEPKRTTSRAGDGNGTRGTAYWRPSTDSSNSAEDDTESVAVSNDEDEFGLPSLPKQRKKVQLPNKASLASPGQSLSTTIFKPGSTVTTHSERTSEDPGQSSLSSGDIAEEREIPTYPNAPKFSSQKILKPQYKELLRDPANSLNVLQQIPPPQNPTPKEVDEYNTRVNRLQKFKRILQQDNVSMHDLREMAWSGIPPEVRAMTWQLLLGYLPTKGERRISTLERKRQEYNEGVRQAFYEKSTLAMTNPPSARRTGKQDPTYRGLDQEVWHQIYIDIPRTNPHIELYGYETTQRSLERILYVWSIRHPASGYVQGINDLATPFWQVFLGMYITDNDIESGMDPGQLPKSVIDAVEADTFWCLTKLLDGIQDNYIRAQPGILRQVRGLQDLTTRIDKSLAEHLKEEGVEFIQFSFRWMNCLLMREFSVKSTIRMWDTYMAEERGFSDFHIYVCAAFLVKWKDKLVKMDFQEIMMFLQALPTKDWTEREIELLLSEAFIWKSLFGNSQAHLR